MNILNLDSNTVYHIGAFSRDMNELYDTQDTYIQYKCADWLIYLVTMPREQSLGECLSTPYLIMPPSILELRHPGPTDHY